MLILKFHSHFFSHLSTIRRSYLSGRSHFIFKVILPSAVPGILAGVVLSTGRIVGETAALIYTAGTVAGIPDSIMNSGRTLSINLYALYNESLNGGEAYATAVIVLITFFGLNAISDYIRKKLISGNKN